MKCKWCGELLSSLKLPFGTIIFVDENEGASCIMRPYTTEPMLHEPKEQRVMTEKKIPKGPEVIFL